MKKSRLISILIIVMMISSPFMSFAVEEESFDASGNSGKVTEAGDESGAGELTEEETNASTDNSTEAAAQDAESKAPEAKDSESKESADEKEDKLPDEPTGVTVVHSVEALSAESDAAYDNDAFFTIDVAKDDSADLATNEVSEEVTDILSGDGSTSEKKNEVIGTLEDSGLYHAEESGKSKVEITSKFAYQRLRLVAAHEDEINAYGATKAVYFEDSYLLSYDSMEAAMLAYDALVSEYGEDSVFIDSPMKLSGSEKGWGTTYMRMNYHKTLAGNNNEVTVAVIDSGIQKSHPVFSGTTILQGKDFINNDNDPADDNGHGTAVCGVLAESTPASVRIMPLKAMDSKGEGSEVDVMNAVRYANNNGADIINLSIGGYLDSESELAYYENIFRDYSSLVICAAGNEGTNMDASGVVEFPGELSSAVCVGSITAGKKKSSFSNYGQAIDFAAPGSSVLLATLDGEYGVESGTSFASPYLASAAAIVKSGNSEYSNAQIVDYLKDISEDMGDTGKDVYFGNGCPRFPADPDYQHGGDLSGQGVTTSVTDIHNKTYNGYAQTQNPTVITNGEILEQGKDYEIRYTNNVNAGKASMSIIGKGDFSGQVEGIRFTIYPKTITPAVTLSGTSFTYTGKEIKPGVTVKDGSTVLGNGTDYTVSYSGNVNAGTGYVKVTCKGNYSGSKTSSFTITPNNTPYKVTPGGVYERRSPTTAVFLWWMDRDPADGASVTINGRKVKPTKNSDGSYSYNVSGLDPGRVYKIPVKVVDRNGRTVSNVMDVWVDRYYKLTPGGVYERRSPTTAEFRWWMNHDPEDGASVTINGRKVRPTKESDGTYSYHVTGLDPGRVYKIPVKIVDRNGRTLSNVMDVWVDRYYKLTPGGVYERKSPEIAEFRWWMNHDVTDGASVTINGRKVRPTKNSDGTYSYNVSGLDPARVYKIPVKVVDRNGRTLSNVMDVWVDSYYKVSAGKVTSRTGSTAVFNWKMNRDPEDGATVTINGRKIRPTKNSDGSYSYNVSGLDPARKYSLPVKVIDERGRTISNVINITVTAY